MLWISIVQHVPKQQRYTIGVRIENTFLDLLQLAYVAYFSAHERKQEKVGLCILKLDTLKLFVHTAWEAKLISHGQYEQLAEKLDEIGKMLGGWKKNLDNPDKKNRTR